MKKTIKEINKLAYPIFLSYFIEVIFGIFDKMIIGRINIDSFNAVSFMSTFLYVLIGALGVISTCFNIIYNKKIKEKDSSNILFHYITVSIIIGISIELLFIFFGKEFISTFYHLNKAGQRYAYEYLIIAGPTVLINLMIFIFSCLFRAHKNTKIQAKVTFVSLLTNLIIDCTLVFGLNLGVKGAAIGTTVGLIIGLFIYLFNLKTINIKLRLYLNKKINKALIKLFIPLFTAEIFETTIFTILISSIISSLNKNVAGVYNVIDTINGLLMLIVYGYSSASLTLTLQKKNKIYPLVSSFLSFIVYSLCVILIIIFSKDVFSIITTQKSIITLASKYIVLGLIYSLFNSFRQIYKDALQGFDKEKLVLILSVIITSLELCILYILKPNNLNIIYTLFLVKAIIESIIYILVFKKILIDTQ